MVLSKESPYSEICFEKLSVTISRFPSLTCRQEPHERLTKLAPVLLIQLNFVFLSSGFNAFPGSVAFRIAYSLHPLEAHDCIAYVSSIMDGFFPFLGEGEVLIGDMIAATFDEQTNCHLRAIAKGGDTRRSIQSLLHKSN